MLEEKVNRAFGDEEPKGFGTGWWSGVLSAFFGFLSFGAVLCLHYPQLLTAPELRPHYPMHVMRIVIQGLIVGAIIFGVVSSLLRKKKVLGLSGMLLAFAAILFGGASVPINQTLHDGPALGLDWFLLDLLMMALIYVPIERLWPQYPDAEHVPPGMDAGRRVLSVDAPSGADPLAHDPVARHRGESTLRQSRAAKVRRRLAVAGSIRASRS